MTEDGQNYSVFNSRMLVDVVGDVTDEALKASRMKDVICLLYTSPSPRDVEESRMPSSA